IFLVLYPFHIFLIRDKYTIFCMHLSMLLFLPFIRILVKSHYISFGVYFFVFFSPLLKQRSDSIIQALFIIFFMHIFFVKRRVAIVMQSHQHSTQLSILTNNQTAREQ